MKITARAEQIIYLFLILASLAIIALIAFSPAGFLDTGAVYRGF
jgi:hypothetical protein